ncbi:phosphoglycerate kinase [Candidatus Gracilibacteria bacterium]|nr:phosphoglycerate kinase [Candidatus Gracilibacteria bacterium]MCF7898958.1 phosphoglycerate kinase [Candidatus Paceibacterota bacterium]
MNTTWKDHIMPDVGTFNDKRVIVRVDWNMPITDGVISDTSRFDVTVPFLKELSFAGAKIIILTHFGEKGESLEIIAKHVTKNLPFISFYVSQDFDALERTSRSLERGHGMLLENVRLWNGETENASSLAKSFSLLGEVFINDAFSVAHRTHSSVVGIAYLMPSYFGPTFVRELEHLTKALTPIKPALLIVGGAKISTKLTLINQYLNQGVEVFVGGAMVHNLWKERGVEIGKSLYDPKYKLPESFINHPLLLTPKDVVLSNGETVPFNKIPTDGVIVDCGNDTVAMLEKIILESKTVIANGPLGLYEKGWLHGSEQILTKLANAPVTSYIGGGDTVSVAHSLHLLRNFTFVSLGGGAMLDFLASGTLPGIDAVTK